jgi:hypothetical protein
MAPCMSSRAWREEKRPISADEVHVWRAVTRLRGEVPGVVIAFWRPLTFLAIWARR